MRMLLGRWTGSPFDLVARLRRENRALRAEIARLSVYKELAYRDDLTQLHNRRFFDERLSAELARSARSGAPLALVIVDIDRFKAINDLGGHQLGDRVLRFFGQFLKNVSRASDIACRLGGDEFALLLPDTDAEGAKAMLLRLETDLASASGRPELPYGILLKCSAGFALAPEQAQNPSALLSMADAHMYARKRAA